MKGHCCGVPSGALGMGAKSRREESGPCRGGGPVQLRVPLLWARSPLAHTGGPPAGPVLSKQAGLSAEECHGILAQRVHP